MEINIDGLGLSSVPVDGQQTVVDSIVQLEGLPNLNFLVTSEDTLTLVSERVLVQFDQVWVSKDLKRLGRNSA